jgi:hypothetical protein
MRKLVSISCLLLLCASWAANAQAQEVTQLPADAPPVDSTVDLYGTSTPLVNSDEIAAQRALKQYDQSMRNWSLPPEKLNEILATSRVANPQDKLRVGRTYDVATPYSASGQFSTREQSAREQWEWSRQRFSDRVADAIYPGFGRIETKHANGATSRIDYINTRRCGTRGIGICWQYRFK